MMMGTTVMPLMQRPKLLIVTTDLPRWFGNTSIYRLIADLWLGLQILMEIRSQ